MTHENDPLCDADPLARALAKLRPTPAGVDARNLLFLAGQAARDRAVTFWRRAFLAQLAVLVALGGWAVPHFSQSSAVEQQTPTVRERIVYVDRRTGERLTKPEEAPPPRPARPEYSPPSELAQQPPSAADLGEYLRVRREVLTAGLGLLPDAKRAPAAPASPAELERSLDLPPGVLTAPYRVSPPKPKAESPDDL
jgi:hypothetical protein